jgi:hypothetical protein
VFEEVIQCLYTNRTMFTKLQLPGGAVCFPGETLKPSVIETHEVGHRSELRESLVTVVKTLCKHTSLPDMDNGDALPETREGPSKGTSKGKMNYRIFRYLCLISFDWKNARSLALGEAQLGIKESGIQQILASQALSAKTNKPSKLTRDPNAALPDPETGPVVPILLLREKLVTLVRTLNQQISLPETDSGDTLPETKEGPSKGSSTGEMNYEEALKPCSENLEGTREKAISYGRYSLMKCRKK